MQILTQKALLGVFHKSFVFQLAALCVGVSSYSEQTGLSKLGNPVRDAAVVWIPFF